MSLAVEKLRLRKLYQGLMAPATAAIAQREAMTELRRVLQVSTALLLQGDNGSPILSPFWGRFK